jgi:hypothetical protein
MAVKDATGNSIQEHPILARLLNEGGSGARAYQGYIAASSREGYVNVYPNLTDLGTSFELKGTDVLHVESIPESFAPFGAVMVWVRGEANVASQVVATAAADTSSAETSTITSGRLQMRVRPLLRKNCISRCECGSTCDGCMSSCIVVCRWPRS